VRDTGCGDLLSIILRQAANGFSLTRDDLTSSYAIIRHNIRTYRSGGVVGVIVGRQNAETALRDLGDRQDSRDQQEGWRYFIEKTNLKAGMDPLQATRLRDAELEIRESKALQDEALQEKNPARDHG
jgi:hypothetical protein